MRALSEVRMWRGSSELLCNARAPGPASSGWPLGPAKGHPLWMRPSTGAGDEMKFIGSEVGKEVIKEEMTH